VTNTAGQQDAKAGFDPKPSRDDIEITREIRTAAETLGIAIHDHW